jgi:molybdopterin-guanine dinucleotide biosynthesis protein A
VARTGLTGVLLVGGASRRFGSPKALARVGEETLAERAWRVLGEVSEEVLAVGKVADGLRLPFPLVDDGTPVRAPIAGVVAGLRAASNDLCVFLPVDCPLVTAGLLLELAEACAGDAAVPQSGPLPGAYRKSALECLTNRLETERLALRDALADLELTVVASDPALLVNLNRPTDLIEHPRPG